MTKSHFEELDKCRRELVQAVQEGEREVALRIVNRARVDFPDTRISTITEEEIDRMLEMKGHSNGP